MPGAETGSGIIFGNTMNTEEFKTLLKPVTDLVAGSKIDQQLAASLNAEIPPESTLFSGRNNLTLHIGDILIKNSTISHIGINNSNDN